jgi:hypothetical protein
MAGNSIAVLRRSSLLTLSFHGSSTSEFVFISLKKYAISAIPKTPSGKLMPKHARQLSASIKSLQELAQRPLQRFGKQQRLLSRWVASETGNIVK